MHLTTLVFVKAADGEFVVLLLQVSRVDEEVIKEKASRPVQTVCENVSSVSRPRSQRKVTQRQLDRCRVESAVYRRKQTAAP